MKVVAHIALKEGGAKRYARIATLLLLGLVLVASCVSFKSMHARFIESMDIKVATKKTIEQHGYDPAYPHGWFLADQHYLTGIQQRGDGMDVYHYALPMLTGKVTCHYYLLVDRTSRIVVGWGFDSELGDPEKTCRIAA
jgi:hypothetical protein